MTPRARPTGLEQSGPPAAQLAQFIHSAEFNRLPASVVDWVKLLVEDSLGCIIGALGMPEARALLALAAFERDTKEGTAIGLGRSSASAAIFCNSQLANLLDFDDMHDFFMPYHPGCMTVPVALAVGEMVEASGPEVLIAIVAAYEVAMRVGRSLGNQLWGGLPPTAMVDELSAAVAAAKLLRLSPTQIRGMFTILAMGQPPFVRQRGKGDNPPGFRLGSLKGNFGSRAQNGYWSALKAQAGLTGIPGLLDWSLSQWYLSGLAADTFANLSEGLGDEFLCQEISLKPAPCCRLTHVPITAAWSALNGRRLDAKHVDRIRLIGVPRLQAAQWWNMVDAQFSIPCTLALAVSGREPGPAWYADNFFASDGIRELAAKVEQELDPTIEEQEILTSRPTCRVEIHLKGGHRLEGECKDLKGSPQNPLSAEERSAKLRANKAHLKGRGEGVAGAIAALDKASSLDDLRIALDECCVGHA